MFVSIDQPLGCILKYAGDITRFRSPRPFEMLADAPAPGAATA